MKIQEVFDRFVTALETNNMELLDSVLDENIEIFSSALDKMKGIKQAKEGLAWKGGKMDFAKIRIFNQVVRQNGNFASQSVFFVILIGKEIRSFMNHFQCGFLNAIEYNCRDGAWKIAKIRSNMTFECGNSLLVAKYWNLIDYSKWDGNDLKIIDTHENSPWELVPETEEDLNEEEKVRQCFYRYNWLIDTNDFEHLDELATEHVFASEFGQTCREDWIAWLRGKRFKKVSYHGQEMYKEACWNHISSFQNIKIDGSKAKADIYRLEPNRIGSRFLHRYNLDTLYYSAVWHINFVRDADGVWKMDSFQIVYGIQEESSQIERRYF